VLCTLFFSFQKKTKTKKMHILKFFLDTDSDSENDDMETVVNNDDHNYHINNDDDDDEGVVFIDEPQTAKTTPTPTTTTTTAVSSSSSSSSCSGSSSSSSSSCSATATAVFNDTNSLVKNFDKKKTESEPTLPPLIDVENSIVSFFFINAEKYISETNISVKPQETILLTLETPYNKIYKYLASSGGGSISLNPTDQLCISVFNHSTNNVHIPADVSLRQVLKCPLFYFHLVRVKNNDFKNLLSNIVVID